MVRVTKPGGLVFVSYTVWWGPWGGHETAPWHYLGGRFARGGATGAGTATSRRTSSASPCSRSPSPTGCGGRTASSSRRGARAAALQPVVDPLAAARPGREGGRHVEPRDRAAQEVTGPGRRTTSRPESRGSCAACVAARRAGVRPRTRASSSRHEVRPGRRPGDFLAGAAPVGRGGRVRAAAEPGLRLPLADGSVLPRLGHALACPAWVVQRLWMALVLCVRSSASARARRARRSVDLACIVAGFAFALSPRMLTTLGPISIEAWPSALAPWVLLPAGRRGASRVAAPAAALSAWRSRWWAGSTRRRRSRCCRSAWSGC